MRTLAKWIWLAFLLPMVVDFVLDRALERQDARPAAQWLQASVEPEAVDPAPGHGAYCQREGGQAPVYFARDLPQLTTYAQFEQWCEFRNGETGWSA